ncbi:MAG TPA: hypothetical protein VG795_10725 [Acidimicrobiia bacterium]|nr:hypothetical protein [Acidimicrobiia bacterium]
MSRSDDRNEALAVESELGALVALGHSRTDAAMMMIERITAEARDATTVVLVEVFDGRWKCHGRYTGCVKGAHKRSAVGHYRPGNDGT